MPSIMLGTSCFFFEHLRQHRKSIAISLSAAKVICIKTPYGTSEDGARKILKQHEKWILARAKALAKTLAAAQVLYHGQKYPLCCQKGALEAVFWRSEKLFLIAPEKKREKELLLAWYKAQALSFLKERVPFWGEKLHVTWQKIAVRDQKTRWGSCSWRGTLSFNFRIVMLPPAVADYIVIHECAHLREFSHAPAFWQLVRQFDPAVDEHRRYLKDAGLAAFHALR